MKDSNGNIMMQEMDIGEMKDTNGGNLFITLPILPIEILQNVFDAITKN